MHCTRTCVSVCVVAVVLFAAPAASAQASLDACGNIAIDYEARCEIEAPGVECETLCTPVRVQASCASELRTVCEDECTTTIVEEVVEVCSESCINECELDPGGFDCGFSCQSRCFGNCDTACASSPSGSRCRASCEANCAGSCSGECRLVLPSATCEQRCTPSCRGEVRARETVQCQVQCQDELFTECEEELVGGCQTECQSSEGVLFCEDQFIDTGSQLEECIDALEDIEIEVSGSASFRISSSGCAVNKSGSRWPGLLFGLLALVAPLQRRLRVRVRRQRHRG